MFESAIMFRSEKADDLHHVLPLKTSWLSREKHAFFSSREPSVQVLLQTFKSLEPAQGLVSVP